jgi:hypothetical protein
MNFRNILGRKNYTNEDQYDLNKKVTDFIDWYSFNCVKENYTEIGEYYKPADMRNLIEKMAVWYELRYPSCEITREFPGCGQERATTDNYFNNITNMDEYLKIANEEEATTIKNSFSLSKWEDILSTKQFFDTMPWEEKCHFSVKYNDIVYIEGHPSMHLHISKKGQVMVNNNDKNDFPNIPLELLKGNIKDVYNKLINNKCLTEEQLKNVKRAIETYDINVEKREGILDCVMYRIIERGGNRIGPHRAFKFALEFNRDIRIPFIYGIDNSDPGLREFIHKGIENGLTEDTKCIENYFSRETYKHNFQFTTIKKILDFETKAKRFTDKEKQNATKLVDLLNIRKLLVEEKENNLPNYASKIMQKAYYEKNTLNLKPMYQLNLERYRKTKEVPDLNMLLWTYLSEHKHLLFCDETTQVTGDFYIRNKKVIDEAINKIIVHFKLYLDVEFKGYNVNLDLPTIPTKLRSQVKLKNQKIMWEKFGNGIGMVSWEMTYGKNEDIRKTISKYDENYSDKVKILTR